MAARRTGIGLAAMGTGGALVLSVLDLDGSVHTRPALALVYASGLYLLGALAPSPRAAGLRTWLAAFVAGAGIFYWISPMLERFAGFPSALAVFVASLLWAAQAIPVAIASWLCETLARRGAPRMPLFAATFATFATLAPSLFPWHPSTSMIDWEVAQLASLSGVALLNGVLFATGAGLGAAFHRGRIAPALGVLGAFAIASLGGAYLSAQEDDARASAPTIALGILQPNISIEAKHDRRLAPAHLRNLRALGRRAAREGAEVNIWPETAFPFRVRRDAQALPRERRTLSPVPALVGALTQESRCGRFNSVLAMDERGAILGRTDKVELLAFGETIPFWDVLPPLQARFPCPGLAPGLQPEPLRLRDVVFGVLICYEDVLGEVARPVARRSELLVNVTNDGWFGESSGPYLHHLAARWRAIEVRRDLVRAVNTGVSAHVDSRGRNVATLPPFERHTLVVHAARRDGESLYLRLGDTFTPLAFSFVVATILAFRLRFRRST